MWGRTAGSGGPAREFAHWHHLSYAATAPADRTHSAHIRPLSDKVWRHCVSGQWRGRPVHRFEDGPYTVEMMATAVQHPTVHLVPSGADRHALAPEGPVTTTGDAAFDRRWMLLTPHADLAQQILTPVVRDALMRPAVGDRAVTWAGEYVVTWALANGTWDDASERLDFLALLADSRSLPARTSGEVEWLPQVEDTAGPAWAIAPLPPPLDDGVRGASLGADAPHAAVIEAEGDGAVFLPEPIPSPHDLQATWRYAPATT